MIGGAYDQVRPHQVLERGRCGIRSVEEGMEHHLNAKVPVLSVQLGKAVVVTDEKATTDAPDIHDTGPRTRPIAVRLTAIDPALVIAGLRAAGARYHQNGVADRAIRVPPHRAENQPDAMRLGRRSDVLGLASQAVPVECHQGREMPRRLPGQGGLRKVDDVRTRRRGLSDMGVDVPGVPDHVARDRELGCRYTQSIRHWCPAPRHHSTKISCQASGTNRDRRARYCLDDL